MALEVDSGPRAVVHETGWLIVVMVVVAGSFLVRVALMEGSGDQSGTRTVHIPSNQIFF